MFKKFYKFFKITVTFLYSKRFTFLQNKLKNFSEIFKNLFDACANFIDIFQICFLKVFNE